MDFGKMIGAIVTLGFVGACWQLLECMKEKEKNENNQKSKT
jgi:hypothetical protein